MIVLSLVYEKEKEWQYLNESKVGLQAADNVYQWNIIDGLLDNMGSQTLYIINSAPVGCYPRSNKRLVFRSTRGKYKNAVFHEIGFLNIPVIKPVMRFFSYIRLIQKYAKKDRRLVIYGLYLPQLLALKFVKLFRPNCVDAAIFIDDLPGQYGILPRSFVRRIIKLFFDNQIIKILNDGKTISHFALLTDQMSKVIQMHERNFTVIEGIARQNTEPESNHFKDSKKKIIYYAGTLNSEYGIETLTDAFMQIQGDEYELWICGDGDARETVEKAALADKRIRYYGFVDKERADELRDLSDVLVNPRTNEGAYTKYSFPSKTIEYMLAAKPIIMYKLDGIPIEYDCFLNYVSGVQPIDLAKKIVDVCVADSKEAEERARDGRKWILKNKNPKAQMAKLLSLFENRV